MIAEFRQIRKLHQNIDQKPLRTVSPFPYFPLQNERRISYRKVIGIIRPASDGNKGDHKKACFRVKRKEKSLTVYLVKAKTKWSGYELTGVAADLDELLEYFKDWTERRRLKPRQIWYSDVFRLEDDGDGTRIGEFTLLQDGNIMIDVDPDGDRKRTSEEIIDLHLRRFRFR